MVSARGPLAGPTAKRMQAARQLAAGLHRLLDADLPGRKLGPAWKLISQVLNKALSYDVCVSPPGRLRPHTDELDALVSGLARRCADPGRTDSEHEWQRALASLRLPRRHGGLDLPSASAIAPFAYLSTIVAVVPGAVSALAGRHGSPAAAERTLSKLASAGLLAEADSAQRAMVDQGVVVDAWGMPARRDTESPTQLDVYQVAKAGINFYHRRRAWLLRRADHLLEQQPPGQRAHHWTHGGEEGGLGFFASATVDLAPWDDCEFVVNMRRRLRLKLVQRGDLCQHLRRAARKQPTGDLCNPGTCAAALDEFGDHPVQCMIGGDHTAMHDAACDEIALMHQQAGLCARREVHVPQLATASKTEPRADIVAWGAVALPVVRFDLTVISPWASRNMEASRTAPGEAARRAEQSKCKEYGSKAGISVCGLAIEAGGRHGPRLSEHLRLLASLARRRDGLAGREPRHHLRQWRQRLAVLLGRFTAQTVTAALGGCTMSFGMAGGATSARQSLRVGPVRRAASTAG